LDPRDEDRLFESVYGGVQTDASGDTFEADYIGGGRIEVQFQTTLSNCSRNERKIEMEFGGAPGTYTAFADGTEIRVEDNSLENGVTETRQMCSDYGDTYTVEQKGQHTDHGSLMDPEIMGVRHCKTNEGVIYYGSNDDISSSNQNARVTFTLN